MKRKLTASVLILALVLGIFAGIGMNRTALADEAPKLRMIMYGDLTPRREEYFRKDFHDKVLEELNIDLSVEFLAWGSDATTVSTMLASGERFAVWNILPNNDWAAKGYLAEIDPKLIEEKLPNLNRIRTENNGYQCMTTKGKIYGIPFGCKPYAGRMQTFEVRNDILKSVGYEAKEITTYDKLMEAIEAVKAANPDLRVIGPSGFLEQSLNAVIGEKRIGMLEGVQFAYVYETDEDDKVYSWYESEEYKNLCAITGEWARRGYIQMDVLSNPSQMDTDRAAGNCLLWFGTPGALVDTSFRETFPNLEFGLIKIGDLPFTKTRDYDWGFSISANDADHVENWLELFDWMYKDLDTYNFCIYGVEGKDWEYAEDGSIRKLVTDTFFNNWFMEAMEYNNLDPSIPADVVEQYTNYDNGSLLSKQAGFTFDTAPVAAEYSMLSSIYSEYLEPMTYGLLDFDSNYEKTIQRMKDAGLDAYLAEYQKQFSEWYAQNKQ